ncbi:MAG: hypothetical protein V3W34_16720 [Phycisphaerae bacterium]
MLALGTFNSIVKGGGPPPVVVDSIEPAEIVQGQVPQPTLKIFGSNFIEGMPSETNRPTVTLRQQGKGGAEFSALAWVNFAGTVATLPPDLINLLPAPLGVYDVTVTRPTDDASDTLKGAFTVTDGEPDPGEIALVVRSAWGGPVNDVEIVGDLAYAAIGRRLVILNVADPADPFEVGSMNLGGVNGITLRDGYAFAAAQPPYRFAVADVFDPSNPKLVSAGNGDGQVFQNVCLYDNLAYLRTPTGNVEVFDITNPLGVVSLGIAPIAVSDFAAMAIVGDLLYVGTGVWCCQAQLRIYDLTSDPLNPVLLGSVDNVGGESTTALDVEGSLVGWTVEHTDGSYSLQIVDVSVPQSPFVVGSYNNGAGAGAGLVDVKLSGSYAYVANSSSPQDWAFANGLMVFDIATDPTNPTVVGTFKTHASVQGVEVVGDRAYLHDAGEGLIILDVSDPANPVRLGNYHSPAALRQMTKDGDLLYVADAWNGFTVLDVSDATQPEVVSVYLAEHVEAFDSCADMSYPLGIDAYGIDIKNNTVYLAAGHLGLEVIDVVDPANPTFIGALRIDQLPPPAAVASKFVGVRVWDDVASIGFEARTCGFIFGIFLNLDVSDPANIFEVGRISHGPERASTIEMNSQGAAFIGRGSGAGQCCGQELTIDTSDPELPGILRWGDIELVSDTALASDESLLYLASSDGSGGNQPSEGLHIQDVTDPANPVVLLHLDEDYLFEDGNGNSFFLSSANAVATQNQRVYVAGSLNGPGGTGGAFGVLDTADPATPVLLDFVPRAEAGGPQSAVCVDEPHVFVTNESQTASAGLAILELVGLSNPADLDGDGVVGVGDLLILLANWGPCADCKLPGDCPPDLNDDCSVGVVDLLILLANWG